MADENKVGRPTKYTPELGDRVCDLIATSSLGLKHLLTDETLPCQATVYNWKRNHPEFLEKYLRAREDQADYMVDETIEIADDGTNDFMTIVKGDKSYEMENKEVTSRSKLRVYARQWAASKLKPKKYGNKMEFESPTPITIGPIIFRHEAV